MSNLIDSLSTKQKIAGAVALGGVSLAVAYYLWRRSTPVSHRQAVTDPLEDADFETKTNEEKALLLKNRGNQFFQQRNYAKAAELFEKAIDLWNAAADSDEKTKNLSILYNNFSACMEYQHDLDKTLEYTSRAIALNPEYAKAYVRRSRIHKMKGNKKACLMDLAKVTSIFSGTPESEKYVQELLELISELVRENSERLFKARVDSAQFLPISQSNLVEWMHQTVLHDPLLARMNAIGSELPDSALDLALYHLKNGGYVKALEIALHTSLDQELDLRERFLARLLAGRVYQFAGLFTQMRFVCQTLNDLWANSSEEFKADNMDLLVALFAFKIPIETAPVVQAEMEQNLDLWSGNADAFIALYMHYFNTESAENALKMLEVAKKVEPNHPNIKYHELSARFLKASQESDMASIHNVTAEMDRMFRENVSEAPEFAVINAAKYFNVVQNTPLSVEIMKKYMETHKNQSIFFQYLYIILTCDMAADRARVTAELATGLSQLKTQDPYNPDINRILARCYMNSHDYQQASECAEQSWLVTRSVDEFAIAYHDVLLTFSLAGREVPLETLLPYTGPDYVRANCEEFAAQFAAEASAQ